MGTMRPAVAAAMLVLAAGCSSGPPIPIPSGSGAASAAGRASESATASARPGPVDAGRATGWTTYHADASRSGFAPGLPAAGHLALGWSTSLDGAVYGQPLVVAGLVIAATQNDSVYGLSFATGQVRWRAHLGTPLRLASQPCGNIDPLGITSTPVFDRRTGLVYVAAQIGRTTHVLAGLAPRTGQVHYLRDVPSPDRSPAEDQQRAALAAGNGRIYVAFGGHFGDCGNYVGSVVGMPASGSGPADSYLVPTSRQAGIWASGGPVLGPDGTVFVSVGNGSASPPYDSSDSVTALSPALRLTGVFAPLRWAVDNRGDLDLGSMTPALIENQWILIVGKSGIGYLLRARHLGGIGGQVAELRVCTAFGGAAVVGSAAYVPCSDGGLAAVTVAGGQAAVRWRGPPSADGSPVVGGHAVWVTDNAAGVLYELDQATGRVRFQIPVGSALPHFASPSLSGRLILIGTLHGVVAITGA